MKSIKLTLVLVVLLAVVVLQNQEPWKGHFLWLSGDVPGIILLFLTAVAGLVAGITAALLMRRDAKRKHQPDRCDPKTFRLWGQIGGFGVA